MERAIDLLEIIHTDVCGPMSVQARGGYRYFLTFRVKEICPRGNNKVVILFLIHDKCLLFMLELY